MTNPLAQAQIMYGVPLLVYSPSPFVIFVSLITTPIVVISSFIVGTLLFLLTHKKVFIIIPLILSVLYFIRYLAEKVLGIYFSS